MPRDDINYKVAISAGAKELEAGQLKRAEEQFRFAVKRCADCGGGYRGLAKVFVELEDRVAALDVLREGAQTLARANNRAEAIELLRDAVRLAPDDLSVHRRYAAALANASDHEAAVTEYDRFVSLAIARGDMERARIEVAYARETLGDADGLGAVEQRLKDGVVRPAPAEPPAATVAAEPAPAAATKTPAPEASAPPQAVVAHQPFEELLRGAPPEPRERALLLESRAQELVARADARFAAAALEAARALLGEGLQHAAADLLLQVVATGNADRDAQRLLVDVAKTLGRGEIARDKCALLAEALRLDGRPDDATEVERLAAG